MTISTKSRGRVFFLPTTFSSSSTTTPPTTSRSPPAGARFLNNNTRVTLANAPGSLELMRCVGDFWGKVGDTPLFSAVPDHVRLERGSLPSSESNANLVIASDGVFGVLSNAETLLQMRRTEQAAAAGQNLNPVELIMRRAIEMGSTDNISCLVIYTKKLGPKKKKRTGGEGRKGDFDYE